MEGSDRRWRGAIAGEGEQSQVNGRDSRWREASADGSDRRRREATAGGRAIRGGGARPHVEGSDRRRRPAIAIEAGGEEQPHVEGRNRRWRGEIAGGGERSKIRVVVEGSDLMGEVPLLVEESDLRWRCVVTCGRERPQVVGIGGSDCRRRLRRGVERSQADGNIKGGGVKLNAGLEVEGPRTGANSSGGEQISESLWRGAIAGGGERSQAEGNDHVDGSDRRWRRSHI